MAAAERGARVSGACVSRTRVSGARLVWHMRHSHSATATGAIGMRMRTETAWLEAGWGGGWCSRGA
jgi:hypothetical protein